MISALVHGNELCGAWALLGLLQAGVRPQRGTLTLAFCNLAAFDRFDPASHDASRFVDEDLNRQWLSERIELGGTQERTRAAELRPFVEQADWLLDLHSMHERGAPLLLVGMQSRNLALAQALGAPTHLVIDAGHKDGVRMRDFARFGGSDALAPDTRSLLIECGFHGDLSSRTVAQDLCTRFLVESGAIDAVLEQSVLPGWRQPDAPSQWALQVTGAVVACNELFRFTQAFQGLELIEKAGTVIGHQYIAGQVESVITPYDNCVLVMPSIRQAKAGVTVVRFATRQLL
jgi:predicted deacylase